MISRAEALDMFLSDDLIGIGMEADAIRARHHPSGVVSYIIDRGIDPRLSREAIFEKVQETIDRGGTGIRFEGGLDPERKIDWYEDLLRSLKGKFSIWLDCFSAAELSAIAAVSGISPESTIARLADAGLDSIPGNGTELDAHRTAHSLGLRTTAAMPFGAGETPDQRMDHLEAVRRLQEETGGFTAFIPWSGRSVPRDEPTAVEYLKTLAISRIYLDNIVNIQSSWLRPGLKTCQVGLRFGGNDVGSVLIEENLTSASGTQHEATEEQLRHMIRNAGFVPKQRDSLYRTYFLN
jgi:cyclic dehypoxanthinyl futalosine synthase